MEPAPGPAGRPERVLLGLWGRRLGNPQRPRKSEHDRPSFWTGFGGIFVVVLEEGCQVLRWEDEIGLETNAMDRVIRNRARSERNASNNDCPAVTRNLPLVGPHQSELEQFAEILLQGKDLPNSPLVRECLTRCFFAKLASRRAGCLSLPVDLPIGRKFVLVPLCLVM
jgi:hypothetical protein